MDAAKLKEMIDCMKELQREKTALEKHNAVGGNLDATKSRRDSARESARECAINIRRLTHDAHCIAVEMGIADRRDDSHYTPSMAPAGFGREFIFERRAPKA